MEYVNFDVISIVEENIWWEFKILMMLYWILYYKGKFLVIFWYCIVKVNIFEVKSLNIFRFIINLIVSVNKDYYDFKIFLGVRYY